MAPMGLCGYFSYFDPGIVIYPEFIHIPCRCPQRTAGDGKNQVPIAMAGKFAIIDGFPDSVQGDFILAITKAVALNPSRNST
jgi:hypothetical protein